MKKSLISLSLIALSSAAVFPSGAFAQGGSVFKEPCPSDGSIGSDTLWENAARRRVAWLRGKRFDLIKQRYAAMLGGSVDDATAAQYYDHEMSHDQLFQPLKTTAYPVLLFKNGKTYSNPFDYAAPTDENSDQAVPEGYVWAMTCYAREEPKPWYFVGEFVWKMKQAGLCKKGLGGKLVCLDEFIPPGDGGPLP